MRLFFGILLAVWVASAYGIDPIDHLNVVVMIDATYAHGKPETGAGIVVDETPARTVVITALHVVQRPDTSLSPGVATS
ncbi:hypothetical protein [Caballeronia sp. LZ001]|uniref:hypothetical protein n=1 Tax=Caballeronia sp. LZ001 TaxID=3038553 RepID=UPI00285BEE02|nr:hypothetical protein [Caballeronia sp. LZ001]MDR5806338.1 hypothetical protein [Caballeronia sp. LZ001]